MLSENEGDTVSEEKLIYIVFNVYYSYCYQKI